MLLLRWVNRNLVAVVALTAFLVMTSMLVFQQHVIENQRTLIRQLYGDSLELTARKVHDLQNQMKKVKTDEAR